MDLPLVCMSGQSLVYWLSAGRVAWLSCFVLATVQTWPELRAGQVVMNVIPAVVQKKNDQLQDEGCLNFTAPKGWWCYTEVVVV